jgi:hypothetical protein
MTCLISWTQPVPAGGLMARAGMQGGTKPEGMAGYSGYPGGGATQQPHRPRYPPARRVDAPLVSVGHRSHLPDDAEHQRPHGAAAGECAGQPDTILPFSAGLIEGQMGLSG